MTPKKPRNAKYLCAIKGCEGRYNGRGLCTKHYMAAYKAGTLPPLETESDKFFAKVDKGGDCWVWTARLSKKGYGQFRSRIQGRNSMIAAHRVSFLMAGGVIPEGYVVDHICRNRACVKPAHLRAVTLKQNGENRSQSGYGLSGVRGVYWHGETKKWNTQVRHNGRSYSAGLFSDLEEAKSSVVALRRLLHTHNDADRVAP